ncbi:hypothetical protein [Pseudorhodoferax sp. Leaf267]|uniref:hypothetical protein n=1 Tax=Pseudorhodoferax sp. Leaf267 TaxID=1736316 RepID=UPI0006F4EF96|nr:hypothetical protein [Pseudorhodoferax sp. Leaf267]KQP12726.1 hypothetical protein ASF43_21125 [Pseudorhodoferax sp. Leaf267]
MQTIIVYIDDAAYARQQLAALCTAPEQAGAPRPQAAATHWVLVACAPRMTHRISKWVSHSARENWRAKWSEKVFGEVAPGLRQRGDRVTEVLAKGPLVDLSAQLEAEYRGAHVLDGRRPKLGHDMQPIAPAAPQAGKQPPWTLPGAVAGIGMLLVLGFE